MKPVLRKGLANLLVGLKDSRAGLLEVLHEVLLAIDVLEKRHSRLSGVVGRVDASDAGHDEVVPEPKVSHDPSWHLEVKNGTICLAGVC